MHIMSSPCCPQVLLLLSHDAKPHFGPSIRHTLHHIMGPKEHVKAHCNAARQVASKLLLQDEPELEVFDNWEGQPGAAVMAGGKSSTRESK